MSPGFKISTVAVIVGAFRVFASLPAGLTLALGNVALGLGAAGLIMALRPNHQAWRNSIERSRENYPKPFFILNRAVAWSNIVVCCRGSGPRHYSRNSHHR
jgi:predicted phosphohydrolase